jgi:cyclohexanecarboxylate-CoA ligase
MNANAAVASGLKEEALFLNRLNSADPQKIAVVDLNFDPAVAVTYAELKQWIERTAQGLVDRGIQPGENVAYLLPNSLEFIVLSAAIWRIDAVACPMLPALREREITFIVNRSKSRILVIPDEFHGYQYPPMVEGIRLAMPRLETIVTVGSLHPQDPSLFLGGLAAREADWGGQRRQKADGNTIAQLMFTSGTTGEPKGVLHTNATLSYALHAHIWTLGLTANDSIWVPSPMAHQTGFLYGMMLAFYLGATQICQASWQVETAVKAIEKHGATFVQAAMPFLADLVRMQKPPHGLKIFVATGAAVPRQLAGEAGRALKCKVIGGWGSTEACLVTVGSPLDKQVANWKSDGRVIEGMAIKVTDSSGRELSPGREGMFRVKTPAMFVGYLDHLDWYHDGFDNDGFFKTGDLAAIDEEGYLYITGREKDVINRGGEKIPSAELEDILYQFPAVRDAAIVAMPDARLNERICAYIVPSDPDRPPTKEDVIAFFKEKGVTKIYWPEHVEWIEKLPVTQSGKVQKYVLRKMIAEKMKTPGFCLGTSTLSGSLLAAY